MDILECLSTRRSVRKFTGEPVSDEVLEKILEAGRLAPSGLNNQPWRFAIIRDKTMVEGVAGLTKYSRVVLSSDVLVAVFLNKESLYNRDKDIQGIGACIENMWLAAHSLGAGMCWIGEILNRGSDVEKLLQTGDALELMAVLCFGIPDVESKAPQRLPMSDLIVKRY